MSSEQIRAQPGGQPMPSPSSKQQIGQKRGGSEDTNNGEEDRQAKRSKTSKPDDGVPDPTAVALLDIASPSILKKIYTEVLRDKVAGARLKEEVISCISDIVDHYRDEAKKEVKAIRDEARQVRARNEKAMKNKCICEREDWPRALSQLLRRIESLSHRSLFVKGPELAWSALTGVYVCWMSPFDGKLRIERLLEDDSDDLYDRVDKLMLFICEAQKEKGEDKWLRDGRKEQIRQMQSLATNKVGTYRFQRTLKFLEEL
ncbi:hypothetical protein GGS24DRAFT_502099 [Hypoxylon argillaceum]|nr:hypothetical protein GGS24DRAFT_502099 [Hypoxylon argillaceum]